MRILHIGNEMSWRGGENQIRLLIEGLRKNSSAECFVAYPRESRGFSKFSELVKVGGPIGVLGLPSRRAFDPRNVSQLVAWCDKYKIDILDAQSSGGMSLALKVKKKRPNLKVVVHRRVDNAIKKTWFTRRKYLSDSVDKFVCISKAISQIVKDYGVNENKIAVIESAVEETPYLRLREGDLVSQKQLAKRNFVGASDPHDIVWFGNASAFTSQKGHDTLIRACAKLRDQNLRFLCWLAGDGPLLAATKRQVDDFDLASHVRFIGHTNKVSELLMALDILAVPSNNEGLGTILLEGAFAGCALVGSSVGGIPEIIIDQKTGYLVPPRDSDKLAEALGDLMADSGLRQKLNLAARAHVRENFSVEHMVRGNQKVYQSLLVR